MRWKVIPLVVEKAQAAQRFLFPQCMVSPLSLLLEMEGGGGGAADLEWKLVCPRCVGMDVDWRLGEPPKYLTRIR